MNPTTLTKTGLGHQLKTNQRSVSACEQCLTEAFGHINKVKSPEVQVLAAKIAGLMATAQEISYAMMEAYNQND